MAQYIIQQIKEQRQTYDKNHIRSFVDIYIKEENEQTGIKNQHDSKCLTLELYFRNKLSLTLIDTEEGHLLIENFVNIFFVTSLSVSLHNLLDFYIYSQTCSCSLLY